MYLDIMSLLTCSLSTRLYLCTSRYMYLAARERAAIR